MSPGLSSVRIEISARETLVMCISINKTWSQIRHLHISDMVSNDIRLLQALGRKGLGNGDTTHPRRLCSLYAIDCVFDDRTLRRLHSKSLRCDEKNIRRGLLMFNKFTCHNCIP